MPTYLNPAILARAEALGLKAKQLVEGLRVGDHKSPYKGFSVEFVQHREYVPGDDIRHIDWKGYGRGATNKLEYAKLLAASLSYMILRQRDSVGLRIFNTEIVAELPNSSQMGHINVITHTLEELQPREKTTIGPMLDLVADQISR